MNATELIAKAAGMDPAATPETPAPAPDQDAPLGAAHAASPQAPTAAPSEPSVPETPEVTAAQEALGLLDELGIQGDRREAAVSRLTKAINDAKGKNGRKFADENRRLHEELASARAAKDALEAKYQQFEPMLAALKPQPAPTPDPVTTHPKYLQAIKAGWSQEQIDFALVPAIEADLRNRALEARLQSFEQQRREQELLGEADAYSNSIQVDESHPIPMSEVMSAIQETPFSEQDQRTVQAYLAGGGTPQGMVEMVYALAITRNPKLRAALTRTVAPAAPPPQAPGKASAAPLIGSAPSPQQSATINDPALALLQAAQRAG